MPKPDITIASSPSGSRGHFGGTTPGAGWLALVVSVVIALAAVHNWFGDQHAQLVSSLGRADVPVATPYQQIRPDFTVDGHMWIRYAVALWRGEEGPQLRHTSIDNAPVGREVHWNSGLAWWLAIGGRVWQAVAGGTLEHGVERWAMWENLPLLAFFTVVLAWWAARCGGLRAGIVVAIAMVGHRAIYEGFWPGYADHHGLIAASILGMMLGAYWMRGGWLRGGAEVEAGDEGGAGKLGRRDEAAMAAQRAALWSGVWGGVGMWVSTASLAPVLALVPLAAGLATLIARGEGAGNWGRRGARGDGTPPTTNMRGEGTPSSTTVKWEVGAAARFDPRVWRMWGRAGALTSFAFYLLEYWPHHLGWRLEVNHPLYALAWWAGAELTAQVLPWLARSGKAVRDGRALAWTAAWAVPLVLAPVLAIEIFGAKVFLLSDPFLVGLHHTITEFLPLMARVRLEGIWSHFETLFIYPLFYVAVLLLMLCGRREARFKLTLALVPALLMQALGFWQVRWGMSAAPAQVVLLIAALEEICAWEFLRRAPWRRAVAAALAMAALFGLAVTVRVVETAKVAYYRAILAGDARQIIYREVAETIRESQPKGKVVLFASPNTSVNVAFFGAFQTLGTLYWENVDGLKAAAEISSAKSEAEAARLIEEYGVTHVALFKDSNYIAEYARLLNPRATEAELKETFGYRVLGQRTVPLWLEPLPYAPPKGLPKNVDPDVLVFRVNPHQTVAQGTYRIGMLQAKLGETKDALASFARVAEMNAADPTPRLRRGELLIKEQKWAEAEKEFDAAIKLAGRAEEYRLLAQAGIAFEGAGELGRAIAYYERALRAGPTNIIAANNLAWVLAVTAPAELHNPKRALELAELCAQAQPDVANVIDTLASAQAANGLFPAAAESAERAAALARRGGQAEDGRKFERKAADYRAGKLPDEGK
ncbi:hypothetical protein K0B96_11130 [Horticoccus luteus]|uniref:Tetratricopeptide repeat protein n=1 Tax=Horticoccus luteus TaxID=2862869 RepID=A0A8F9TTQ5_9BACT|nr:hypothetical protein [Horticoccus luteus]QYM77871.1 hypothetical protein K0B96_11130 [Horticoccus luteus]